MENQTQNKSLLILEIDSDTIALQILRTLAESGIERVYIKPIDLEQLPKKKYKRILYIAPV